MQARYDFKWMQDPNNFSILPHVKVCLFIFYTDIYSYYYLFQVPFQNNTFDCGVFTVIFARHLCKAASINHSSILHEWIIQEKEINMDVFRLKLIEELVTI